MKWLYGGVLAVLVAAPAFAQQTGSISGKVTMPDGKVYTLPNVLSASGARYTNEIEKVWWTKGRTAFVQERDKNGEWQVTIDNCREVNGK